MIHASQVNSPDASRAQEYLAGWQRARAELANFRQQQQARQAEQSRQAQAELVMPLLSLADNFRAMTAHVPDDLSAHAWTQGVLHIARQLDDILRSYGVTVIDATQVPFDPRQHEAVAEAKEGSTTQGQVIEVVRPGYKMGEAVLRPAQVKVTA